MCVKTGFSLATDRSRVSTYDLVKVKTSEDVSGVRSSTESEYEQSEGFHFLPTPLIRWPANSRRISGRRFSPSPREATTGNASAVRRLLIRKTPPLTIWWKPDFWSRKQTRINTGYYIRSRSNASLSGLIGHQSREATRTRFLGFATTTTILLKFEK